MHFRTDDRFDTLPEVRETSDAALGLLWKAGTFCARALTDGYVHASFVADHVRGRLAKRAAGELEERGWWEPDGDGYRLVGYLDPHHPLFNLSAEQVRAIRDREAKKKRDQRNRGKQSQLPWESPTGQEPVSPGAVPPHASNGVGGENNRNGQENDTSSDTRPRLTPTGGPADEVLEVLAQCPRLFVDDITARLQVENAVQAAGGWGQCDPVAAAHEAVAAAADPTWQLTNVGRLMSHFLRKQAERRPAGRSKTERQRDDLAALERLADRGGA